MATKITKINWKKNQTIEEWTSARCSMEGIGKEYVRIGGSDLGNVLFSSKYKCPRRLAKHLVGEYSFFEITDTTLDGIMQEPILGAMWESFDTDEAVSRYQTQHNIKVRKVKKAKFFLLNSNYPNIFISLDFIPVGKQYSPFTGELYHPLTPIEAKTTSKDYYRNWNYKGFPITQGYYAQLQGQMCATNTQVAVFIVKLRESGKFIAVEIPRDEEFIEWMIPIIHDFCETVKECKVAYYRYLLCTDEVQKETLRQIYEDLLPPYGGSDDDVALADEMWLPPIDPDADYLMGDDVAENMMASYIHFGEVENMCKEEKNKLKANLKHLSSGFQGIKTANHKAIIRGQRSDKKAYFGVSVNKPI